MTGRARGAISLVTVTCGPCERYSPVNDVYHHWDELVKSKSYDNLPLSLHSLFWGAKVTKVETSQK